jgi:hypothetical protein
VCPCRGVGRTAPDRELYFRMSSNFTSSAFVLGGDGLGPRLVLVREYPPCDLLLETVRPQVDCIPRINPSARRIVGGEEREYVVFLDLVRVLHHARDVVKLTHEAVLRHEFGSVALFRNGLLAEQAGIVCCDVQRFWDDLLAAREHDQAKSREQKHNRQVLKPDSGPIDAISWVNHLQGIECDMTADENQRQPEQGCTFSTSCGSI